MNQKFTDRIGSELAEIENAGLSKKSKEYIKGKRVYVTELYTLL